MKIKNNIYKYAAIVFFVLFLFQLWEGKIKGEISTLGKQLGIFTDKISPHIEFPYNPNFYDDSFFGKVQNTISWSTESKPIIIQTIDTVRVKELPAVPMVSMNIDNSKAYLFLKINNKIYTYTFNIPEEGETYIIPTPLEKDKLNLKKPIQIKTQRFGFMKAVGVGMNNKIKPEINFDFLFWNKLPLINTLRLGLNYEYTNHDLGNIGFVGSVTPYYRFNRIQIYAGWYFPDNMFRLGLKIRLFSL